MRPKYSQKFLAVSMEVCGEQCSTVIPYFGRREGNKLRKELERNYGKVPEGSFEVHHDSHKKRRAEESVNHILSLETLADRTNPRLSN
jgi:hypothetical protein